MIINKYTNLSIRLIIFFLGLITTVNLIFSSKEFPQSFYLIPLSYSILILIFPSFTKYIFRNIGLFTLNACMFIRYLLSPLLISFEGVYDPNSIVPFNNNYTIATYLMLYELVVIFFIFQLLYKKFYDNRKILTTNIKAEKNLMGWAFVVFCILIIVLYPEVLSRYSFIWLTDELKSKEIGIEIISSIPLLVQIGTLVLTISIVNQIYKRYSNNNRFVYVLLSICIVFLISSFIVGTSRNSVILPLVTGLYIIFISFQKHKKVIGGISVLSVMLFILFSTLLKETTIYSYDYTLYDFFSQLNINLQRYFSGLNNVAISVQTSSIYSSFNIESILSDITRNIVLINSFFQSEKSALIDFNIVYYNGGFSRDQILPLIGQGYLYFGFLLAPLFTIIILILLMYFDSKVLTKDGIIHRYIYAYVALKLGTFMMANFTILISFITNYFLILLLLVVLNRKVIGNRGDT